jgi:hypothetical protein
MSERKPKWFWTGRTVRWDAEALQQDELNQKVPRCMALNIMGNLNLSRVIGKLV